MRQFNWKRWAPLMVGALIMGVAVWSHLSSRSRGQNPSKRGRPTHERVRTIQGVRVHEAQRPPVVVPGVPDDTLVAGAAERTQMRRRIQRAITAEVKRDVRTRKATVARLKKDRQLALMIIEEEFSRARLPEHMRQLDMLSKEVILP